MDPEDRIRLLSYNLNLLPGRIGNASDSGHGHKAERLSTFIEEHLANYDVIALQEVFSTPYLPGWFCRQRQLLAAAEAVGLKYHVKSHPPSTWQMVEGTKWTDSGLLILSRFPIVAHARLTFRNSGAHMDQWAMKGCIFACIELSPGTTVSVFNCHLQATHTSGGAYEVIRESQLRDLRAFISEKTHEMERRGLRGPIAVTGDFNVDAMTTDITGEVGDSRGSVAYRHLVLALSGLVCGRNMVDVLYEQEGCHVPTRPPRQTLPRSAASSFSDKHHQRLDYVFWDGGKAALKPCRTAVEKFTAPLDQPFSHLSDHFGILVEFTVPELSIELTSPLIGHHQEYPAKPSGSCGSFSMVLLAAAASMLLLWSGVSLVILGLVVLVGVAIHQYLRLVPLRAPLPTAKDVPQAYRDLPELDTVAANWRRAVRLHGGKRCFGSRPINRTTATREEYVFLSYHEVSQRVTNFGAGLARSGVKAGEAVGLWSEARRSWVIAELACALHSFITVPINAEHEGQTEYIRQALRIGRCRVVVCNRSHVKTVLQCRTPYLRMVVQMQDAVEWEDHSLARRVGVQLITFAFVEAAGKERPVTEVVTSSPDSILAIHISPDSGQTGGVAVTNRNFMASVRMMVESNSLGSPSEGGVHLSHFMMGRPLERIVQHSCFFLGYAVGFFQGEKREVLSDVRVLRPTFWLCQPSFLRKIRDGCLKTQRTWRGPYRYMWWAAYRTKALLLLSGFDSPLLNQWFFHPWQRQFGGKLRTLLVDTQESLDRRTRVFATLVFCCRVHTVLATHDCGLVLMSGRTMRDVRVRLGELDDAAGAPDRTQRSYSIPCLPEGVLPETEISLASDEAASFVVDQTPASRRGPQDGYKQLWVSGPAVREYLVGDDGVPRRCDDVRQNGLRWCVTSIIVRWSGARDEHSMLEVIGNADGLLWPSPDPDVHVLANVVERRVLGTRRVGGERRLVLEVLVTCKPAKSLVAIAVPDDDELTALARDCHLTEAAALGGGSLYAAITPVLLELFETEVRGYVEYMDSDIVRGVYLLPKLWNTSLYRTSRCELLQQFDPIITKIYELLDDPSRDWRRLYSDPSLAPSLPLPREMRGASWSCKWEFHASADFGSIFTKMAFVTGPLNVESLSPPPFVHFGREIGTNPSAGEKMVFLKVLSKDVLGLVEWLQSGGSPLLEGTRRKCFARVASCGGSIERYREAFRESLGLTLHGLNDLECCISGLNCVLSLTPDEVFDVPPETPAPATPAPLASPSLSPSQAAFSDDSFVKLPQEHQLHYPYLVVNVGSGVSFYVVKDAYGSFDRVAGSAIGGGTFWGLCKLLTKIRSWDELTGVVSSKAGDNSKVDLLVRDTYLGSSKEINRIGLTGDVIASHFGRVGRDWAAAVEQGRRRSPVDPMYTSSLNFETAEWGDDDMAASLMMMVGNNIANITQLIARLFGVETVYFCGGFVHDNPLMQARLAHAVSQWSSGATRARFLVHCEFLTAAGGLLQK